MKSKESTNYRFLVYLIVFLVAVYITVIYFIMDPTTLPFMESKLNMNGLPFGTWRNMFYAHILIGLVSMVFGAILVLNRSLKSEKFHVNIGVVYTSSIFINALIVPFLAIYATGGILTGAIFLVIDAAWLISAWLGVMRILQKKYHSHREWLLKSYAITMVFVPFRIFVALISYIFDQPDNLVYPISITIAVILNIAFAEWYIRKHRGRLDVSPDMIA
jgi:hypothetical protein